MTVDFHSKFQGAMIGSALGDAIGELAFSLPDRDQLLGKIAQSEQLTYTDDTAMTVALAENLIDVGDIKPQLLGETFRTHYRQEPDRGYGQGPPQIFTMVEDEGISYHDAAQRLFNGQGSCGNGAAMRVTPVGLFYNNSEQLYDKAQGSAQVTHSHPVGIDGAAGLARAVAKTVKLNCHRPFSPQTFIQKLVDFSRTTELKEKLALIPSLLKKCAPPTEAANTLGTGVLVHESMPFAIFCFLRHPHTFMECILCAVLNGGDRDTIGAMAGAVSGAYLGIEAIPVAWHKKLENNQHIETLARELAARC